jgi:AcrR family transcriptional regulator
MTAATTFQRARSPEHKRQRREAILTAARELALRDGVRTVSLGDIAERIGIHKSALLRYFETREQIFLELTARCWSEWAGAVRSQLDAAPPGASTIVAEVLARSFAERPLLCDLIPHTALTLERNVSVQGVREYKLTSKAAVDEAAAAIGRILPELTATECGELVSTMALLAGSMWQISTPPPALAELYRSDPDLAHARVDLEPRLRRAASIILAGLIPSRDAR